MAATRVVSGMAINMLASGLTIVFGEAWFRQGGATPALPTSARFMPLDGVAILLDAVPLAGPALSRVLGGHGPFVYGALLAVPLAHLAIARTRFGLRLRAVGEAPQAVDAAGHSVAWLRYGAVALCGLLTGLAGTHLALAQNAGFSREMTAGQGYIALAALIFGKWRAWPAFAACGLFGLVDAVAIPAPGRPDRRGSARSRCRSSRSCPTG